jgi:hypothetical protein
MCHVLVSVYHKKNGFSILVGDIFEDESANVCGGTLGTKGTARAVPFVLRRVDKKDANIFTPFFDQSRSYISGSIRFSGAPYIS